MSLIGATKESILRELDGEPKHGYAIANVADISKGGIYSHLRDLEEAGMVAVDEEDEEAEELRKEIEDLEGRIDELTSFRTGAEVHE